MSGFPKRDIETSLPARFEAQVQRFPSQAALRGDNLVWSYQELNRCANRLARQLPTPVGDAESPVLLLIGHGPLEIIALFAVLKSGRAYVVLDPQTPLARLQLIATDVGAELILTSRQHSAHAAVLALQVVILPEAAELLPAIRETEQDSDPNLRLDIKPDALASLVYTSGSTGTPKGVMRSHRCSLHRCWLFQHDHRVGPGDRIAHMFSCSFVAAEVDVYGALLNGATLCCYPLRHLGFGPLGGWLAHERITLLHPPLTLWRRFLAHLEEPLLLPELRTLFLGGEALFRHDIEKIRQLLPGCSIEHRLSSSEASMIARQFLPPEVVCEEEIVAVGHPVADKEVLLLDQQGKEAAVGEVAEIVVSSRYLAPGYWRQPEQTAARFTPCGDAVGELPPMVSFRTGDLGRFDKGGRLYHLGRGDDQLKVNGHRVESGEIEAALLGLGTMKEAAVIGAPDERNEMRLLAAVVPKHPASWHWEETRHLLTERLPLAIIPAHGIALSELPTTGSGKVDRQRLTAELSATLGWCGSFPARGSGANTIGPRISGTASVARGDEITSQIIGGSSGAASKAGRCAANGRRITEAEIRTIIAEALDYAKVFAVSDKEMMTLFLHGHEDIAFSQLGIDSLAIMELCIAIEDRTGVSIAPDDLQRIGTLNRLVKTVKAGLK